MLIAAKNPIVDKKHVKKNKSKFFMSKSLNIKKLSLYPTNCNRWIQIKLSSFLPAYFFLPNQFQNFRL